VCLVLSDRKAHCEALQEALRGHGIKAAILTGDLGNGERQAVVEALNMGGVKVLVATGQLIGEGFDCRELSTLFLATPIKFNGRLLQYLGRVLRPAPGKDRARVYDYLDPVGVLENAAQARQRVYGGE
jgi:superfamily II DNA or RNA helicase